MATRVFTDDELLHMPKDGFKRELVDGELVVSPAGWLHARIVARLVARLGAFVQQNGLGDVLGSNALYVLAPDNKRAPDVSFVTAGRLERDAHEMAFPHFAPDLAVEILSPGDSPRQVLAGVGEYLAAGVRLVWVIDPEQRRAVVYRSLTDVRQIGAQGALEGEDLLPGFGCPLAEVLD